MRRWRIAFATAGIALGLFGAFRLLTQIPITSVLLLAAWMIAAVVIHDGVLSPLVIAVGALVGRVPPRARRYLQAGLIVAGCVSVIALLLIARRGSQPSAKAILLRNYAGNLTIVIAVVAALSLLLYAVHVARDLARARPSDEDGQK